MAFGLPRKGLLVRKAAPTPIKGDPEPGAVFMKTTLVADPPVWPDWSVTAGIASVAGTLARMRERQATYGYREADSSLTPAVEGLRELAAAGGDDAAALANAAGHLAAAQRCLDDAWLGDDDERRRGGWKPPLPPWRTPARVCKAWREASSKLPVPPSGVLKAILHSTTKPVTIPLSWTCKIRPVPPPMPPSAPPSHSPPPS